MLANNQHSAVRTPAYRSNTQVIALHCSGGKPSNWKSLAERVGNTSRFIAPSYYGYGHKGKWEGQHGFTLADEAADIIKSIDSFTGQTHLVGHSYGGALALHIASVRPQRIASVSLYEPCAFHLLKDSGCVGNFALEQIKTLAECVTNDTAKGDYASAMCKFVDYWNGNGTWDSMPGVHQAKLLDTAVRLPHEFNAAFTEPTSFSTYHKIVAPIQIVYGEYAPLPTMFIAKLLALHLSDGHSIEQEGAGHMGPLTHAPIFADQVARHILSAQRFKQEARNDRLLTTQVATQVAA